jgi:YbbR domain-containing protein
VRSLLKAVTRNWKLKLLAFAMALLLWIVVSADQITSQWINVPLQVELQDDGWELVDASVPADVSVRFIGAARELFDVTMDRPRVVLRVTEVESATQSFALDASMVRTARARAFSAQDIRPGQVRLRFERLAVREVPVQVEIGRAPGASYVLADSLVVVPARVTVRGGAAAVAQVAGITTQPLDLSREDATFQRRLRLVPPSAADVRLDVDAVTVTGRVDRVVEATYENVAVGLPNGVRAAVVPVSVRLRGPRDAVAAVRPDEVRVVAVPDSIPSRWPESGVLARLRVQPPRAGVTAEVTPDTIRLFAVPVEAPEDGGPQP